MAEIDLRSTRTGPLAIIGGRLESDNKPLFEAMRLLCGGRIAVLSMASQSPLEVGEELVADFARHGVAADAIPLYWEDRERSAFDAGIVRRLADAGSVFFSGGDQSRILQTLLQDGIETPALACIRSAHASGALVAGTSAGAAIMSSPMILGGSSLAALGIDTPDNPADGFGIGPGLGFFPWGIVDQHFLQRGRIGRMLVAARMSEARFAFGVDENTALLVSGSVARVCGESGVLLADLRAASGDRLTQSIDGVRVSYLDDGDGFDLERGLIQPAADKQPVLVGRNSFRHPAVARRHPFASYALHELMLRLVEGDPDCYRHDSAATTDEASGRSVELRIERVPGESRALRAERSDGEIRYSAIDFRLSLRSDASVAAQPMPVLPAAACPDTRLVLLGNTPLQWSEAHLQALRAELREPVGVIAAASARPRATARAYVDWLQAQGLRAELLDVSLSNIERASRDHALLTRIASVGSLMLSGGNQGLLLDTLLHCGETTPVLQAILDAWRSGTPLIAVAAAAAAMGSRMIAEGDSPGALRLGVSEDAGFEGLVVEPGLGLNTLGLIDQNFLERHRLGRLLVACAATGSRHGFGICEQSGMIVCGGERRISAFGKTGVVVAALELEQVRFAAPDFDPRGIRLALVAPGQSYHLDTAAGDRMVPDETAQAMLERAVRDLARDCNASRDRQLPRIDAGALRAALIT
jgi:cyanophycinase